MTLLTEGDLGLGCWRLAAGELASGRSKMGATLARDAFHGKGAANKHNCRLSDNPSKRR